MNMINQIMMISTKKEKLVITRICRSKSRRNPFHHLHHPVVKTKASINKMLNIRTIAITKHSLKSIGKTQ